MSGIELLCTLGPASMNDYVIDRLTALGVTLFRINLSHTKLEDLASVIDYVRSRTPVPICLDTEGAQIRTGPLVDRKITVRENRFIAGHARPVPGDAQNIGLYPGYIVGDLVEGDFISIDFDSVLAQVVEQGDEKVVMRILNGGEIGQNRAVTVQRPIRMPPLTQKDREAIAIGRELGIRTVALSFANRESDVDDIRAAIGEGATIISKIECRNALNHLEAIAVRSDAVLIDRGDLSREIPIEQIPAQQKAITRRAKAVGTKVYVATNLLESMIDSPTPTRAEVNDIYNTLQDGADGLVLAAETAIGSHPVGCANMVTKLVRAYRSGNGDTGEGYSTDPASLLVEPHGGRLIQREADEADRANASAHLAVAIDDDGLRDVEQLALGTYSPLTGFMDRKTLSCVLEHHALPSGVVWPMPIVLPIGDDTAACLHPGQRIALTTGEGQLHSLLDVTEVYPIDLAAIAPKWFGDDATARANAARLTARGTHFLSGDVTLAERRPSSFRRYNLSPAQLRFIFSHKGWSRVVGFDGYLVANRADEHIQLTAIERTHADGLLVSPVVGVRGEDCFPPQVVFDTYQAMLDFGLYPDGKVVLGCFVTGSRFGGAREAVASMLCHKNMGCSHIVVERDDNTEDVQSLLERIGDIGIDPMYFDPIGYDDRNGRYADLGSSDNVRSINCATIRAALAEDRPFPEWMMRSAVQEVLRFGLAAKGGGDRR